MTERDAGMQDGLRGNEPWRGNGWQVSRWNFSQEVLQALHMPDDVGLHDVTLRDGEQFAGVELDHDDRLLVAQKLCEAGVSRIEGGRVGESKAKNATIAEIVKRSDDVPVFGFTEMSVDHVRQAADCGVKGVVVCFCGSAERIRDVQGREVNEVLDVVREMLHAAKARGLKRVLFPYDGSRAEPEGYRNIVQVLEREVGFDSLAMVDSFGVCSPFAVPALVQFARSITDVPIEVHFHNDFGFASANAVMALASGASVAHTSVSGTGERAGNASFEEVALALATMFGRDIGVKTERFCDLSRTIQKLTGIRKAANTPIVGRDIYKLEFDVNMLDYFTSEEADAWENKFAFRWNVVGSEAPAPVLGFDSGPAALEFVLQKLGMSLSDAQKETLLGKINKLSHERRSYLTLNAIKTLVSEE